MFRARSRNVMRLLVLLAGAFGSASGCAALFGMDEGSCFDCQPTTATLDSRGDTAPPDGAQPDNALPDAGRPCTQYCDLMEQTCTDPQAKPYRDRASCLKICQAFPEGEPDDTTGHSLACRLNRLRSAEALQETDFVCLGTGRGGQVGRDDFVCGSNCTSYCQFMERFCGEEVAAFSADCLTTCGLLEDRLTFDATFDERMGGDTVQCRLWHVGVAAGCDADEGCRKNHCGHAAGLAPCAPLPAPR